MPDKTSAGVPICAKPRGRARPATTGRRRREREREVGEEQEEEEMEAQCPHQQVPGIVLGGRHHEGGVEIHC